MKRSTQTCSPFTSLVSMLEAESPQTIPAFYRVLISLEADHKESIARHGYIRFDWAVASSRAGIGSTLQNSSVHS